MARLFLIAVLLATGCSGLFYYPMRAYVLTPDKLGLSYEEISIPSGESTLQCWLLRAAQRAKGTIIHLHGNAENISTHISSVYWLPDAGYDVLLVDYRGYGRSVGVPSPAATREDAQSAIRYALSRPDLNGPFIVLGQSLGGAVSIDALADLPEKERIAGLVVESTFSSYRTIARDKIGALWVLWPFSYPLSLLFNDAHSPVRSVASIAPVPLLIMHGTADDIVPVKHSRTLYEAAAEPKTLWTLEGGRHIEALHTPEGRRRLLDFIKSPPGPAQPRQDRPAPQP